MNSLKERPTRLLCKQDLTPYSFHYGGFEITVHMDVFPPYLSSSSLPLFDIIGRYASQFALDMGCGTGILALQLSKISKLVIAVDSHLPAIQNAKENILLNQTDNV